MTSSLYNINLFQTTKPSQQPRHLKLSTDEALKLQKLFQGFNSNKDHEYDGTSIIMIKVCGPSLIKAPSNIPVYKIGNKQSAGNYRFVSLFGLFQEFRKTNT